MDCRLDLGRVDEYQVRTSRLAWSDLIDVRKGVDRVPVRPGEVELCAKARPGGTLPPALFPGCDVATLVPLTPGFFGAAKRRPNEALVLCHFGGSTPRSRQIFRARISFSSVQLECFE